MLLVNMLTVIALVVVMILHDMVLSLAMAVLFPLIFMLVAHLSRRIRAVANAETELTGSFFSVGSEAFEGIKTVKSYQLEERSIGRFEAAVEKLQERLVSSAKIMTATVPIMEALGGIVIGLFLIYAASQTITQGQTPGEFTAVITPFLLAYQPAERLSKSWVEPQKSVVHLGRMCELLDAPPRQKDDGTLTLDDVEPGLMFEDVDFAYSKSAAALRDVSFSIWPGERIAIVGRSGAGKTTLVDPILRFYDPARGQVMIGGRDLREVSQRSLRRSIAFISQDVFLFDRTIRDGNPDATDVEIEEAALRAQLMGENDILLRASTAHGPNGSNLSGGQRQGVGIARALARHAKIYIFGEATSALDAQNERLIMEIRARNCARRRCSS